MKFTPINRHIEVEPLEEGGVVATQNSVFEEKGKILAIAHDIQFFSEDEIGCIVFFDAYLVAKYKDSDGKERWLVPEENIRAYESVSE